MSDLRSKVEKAGRKAVNTSRGIKGNTKLQTGYIKTSADIKRNDIKRDVKSNEAGRNLRGHAASTANIAKNKSNAVRRETAGSNSAIKRKVSSAAFDAGVYGENKKPKDYRRKK